LYLFTNEEIGLLKWLSKKINYVSDVPILLSLDDNNGLKGSAEAFYNLLFQRQKVSILG
jgi:hypothetical protein